jgi:HK97 gp10 family phage protein
VTGIQIGIDEVNQVAIDMRGAGLRAQVAAAHIVAKSAHDVETTSKQIAPVDTGALRNSIGTDITDHGLTADIGPTVEYGPYVEYGTSRMAPRAYMGPALDRHSGEFVDALGEAAGRSVWP